MAALKSRVLIELTGRYLTDADQVRLMVAAMKPKTHLVMSGWRWIEARGLRADQATKLVEDLRQRGLKIKVSGLARAGRPAKELQRV
jgi:hypothetical protein